MYGANLLDTHAFALNSNEELNISNDGYEIVAKGRKPWALSSQSILYLLGKTVYATFDDFDATGTKATINIQEVKKSGTRYIPVKNKENRITFSDDCHRLYLRVISNDSGAEKEENNVVTVKGLRITAGSGVQWGSYKARQTLSVRTTNGLPGIPVTENTLANYTDFDGQMWCCDEVDFERGVHVKRIEKMNLTSDLGYKIEAEKAYTRFKILCDSKMVKERIQVISNRFTYGATHKVGTAFTYSGYIYIYPPKTVTTVDELKTWLDANPTEVFYILENPIEKQITEEEMEAFENLKTNENVTTVLNSESAYMSVGYKVPLPRQSKNSALKMWFREHPII